MQSYLIPVKTAQGHDELSSRQRRVGQRHRTLLLLLDGQRTVEEVLQLSAKAGVPSTCLTDLVALGLVVVPQSGGGSRRGKSVVPASPEPMVPTPSTAYEETQDDFLEYVHAAVDGHLAQNDDDAGDPPAFAGTLHDTEFGVSTVITDSVFDDPDEAKASFEPLEEARRLLMHAVSHEAPVMGALTLMRLKRARTAMELLALITEVESRVNRPHRAMATQQLMGRVAQLLSQSEARHRDVSDAY